MMMQLRPRIGACGATSSSGAARCAKRRAVAAAAAAAPPPAASAAPRIALSADLSIAPIVNGCWQLAGGRGRELFAGIEAALGAHADAGFDAFDTADIYGPSEAILGAFREARAAGGKPPVKILTKYVPNVFQERVTPAAVEAAVKRSLAALRAQKLDLVQMHWWDYSAPGMLDAGLALADLRARGLIGDVGVTNMDCAALAALLDAGVPVVSNQVQLSLLDRRPLAGGMADLCRARGVKLLAYGPVGGGLLSDRYVEEPKRGLLGGAKYSNVDLNTSSLKMYYGVVRRFGGQELWRRLLRTLRAVADRHNVTVAAVALRWVMDAGGKAEGEGLVAPIVGVRGAAHIADNAAALALKLDAADRAAIDEVLADAEGPAGDIYSFERGG